MGEVIVGLILVPNVVYALRGKGEDGLETPLSKVMTVIEQLGRYACIIFMWLPLFVWKFGFRSVGELLLYVVGNGLLIILYFAFWVAYFRKRTRSAAVALAVLPTCIFLLSGLLLRHWVLVLGAVLFGIGHIYLTDRSHTAA